MVRLALLLAASVAAPAAHAQAAPEFGFGVALTSNYVFRGETQSDDRAAVQLYGEGAIEGFYLGAWGSTVRLDDDRFEFNLYAGLRGTVGLLAYDVGYVRYLYDQSGDCCGEAFVSLDHPFGETVSFGVSFFHDFDLSTSWADARGEVTFADWTVSGALGTDFGSLDLGSDKVAWNMGVSRSFGAFSLDARYHDSSEASARGSFTIAFDF